MRVKNGKYHSDEDLIHFYHKRKDEKWIGILLDRYLAVIFGVCMRYLKDKTWAEDLTQQVCITAIEAIRKGSVRNFKPWLYQVTKNECLMYLRKNKRTPLSYQSDWSTNEQGEVEAEDPEEKEAYFKLMETALLQLKPPQRKCIQAFYYGEKSYQTISEELGFSIKQVKSHIQNGRRNLKILIEKIESKKEDKNG